MKSKKSEPKAKVKVKIGKLKIHKETIENLSDRDAASVKGGAVAKDPTRSGMACSAGCT